MSPDLINILRCPESGSRLNIQQDFLKSENGQIYPIIQGIPCLLPNDAKSKSTHRGYDGLLNQNQEMFDLKNLDSKEFVKKHIKDMIVPTCGNLYRAARLERWPIPIFPDVFNTNDTILDIGCNWGRWSAAAAKKRLKVVGVDIDLRSLFVAKAMSVSCNGTLLVARSATNSLLSST